MIALRLTYSTDQVYYIIVTKIILVASREGDIPLAARPNTRPILVKISYSSTDQEAREVRS